MNGKKSVVALVDDDPRMLESLKELMESAGYEARSFSSADLLLVSGLSGVDVLISDIGLPGTNGFELRDRVKEERPDLPVFLITGRHEMADQQRVQEIGEFFRKPFDARVLLSAVGNAMKGRNMEDEEDES